MPQWRRHICAHSTTLCYKSLNGPWGLVPALHQLELEQKLKPYPTWVFDCFQFREGANEAPERSDRYSTALLSRHIVRLKGVLQEQQSSKAWGSAARCWFLAACCKCHNLAASTYVTQHSLACSCCPASWQALASKVNGRYRFHFTAVLWPSTAARHGQAQHARRVCCIPAHDLLRCCGAQGMVTCVRDKPAAEGRIVAVASIVLSDFKVERLELPWAAAQEFLIAQPGAWRLALAEHTPNYQQTASQLARTNTLRTATQLPPLSLSFSGDPWTRKRGSAIGSRHQPVLYLCIMQESRYSNLCQHTLIELLLCQGYAVLTSAHNNAYFTQVIMTPFPSNN